MTPIARASVLLLTTALLSACGGSDPLSDDEHGAEACRLLEASLSSPDDKRAKLAGLLTAGEEANQAGTPAIKAAAIPFLHGWLADTDELHAACESEGVDLPDLPT